MLLFCAAPARAQHMNQKDSPGADAGTTAVMVRCFSKAKDSADAKLNEIYKNVHARLEAEDAGRLTAAQRAWIPYRDANSTVERELYQGGTADHLCRETEGLIQHRGEF
jgi:uncharacterized protein YecT (DUF1311 family)